MLAGIGLVILLVLATAFFVAVEFALVSVRRTRIEQLASEGNASAVLVKRAVDNLNYYLAAAQVGITMATIGLGTLGEPVVAQMIVPLLEVFVPHEAVETFTSLHGIAFIIALLLVTAIELIFGENVPKIASIQRSEAASMLLIRPMNLFVFVFKPFIWVINMLTGLVLRLIGLPPDTGHGTAYTIEELEMIVASSRKAGVLDREEEVILRRVFDFGDLTAKQVMRPRTEVVGIPVNATLPEVIEIMLQHRHSRFPVYETDLDHIVGVLHVKDVFAYLARQTNLLGRIEQRKREPAANPATPTASSGARREGAAQPRQEVFDVRSLMRPVEAVPETLDVADLLPMMQQKGLHMVVVVDEYGGTAGVVTLEDIVEEIVGEVRDEFESGETVTNIQPTPEGTMVDGLTPIDDVNEALGLNIQSEADTLGGYVFEVLGRKPELGDEIICDGYVMRVESLDNLRIAKVRVMPRDNRDSNRHHQLPPEGSD
jgi:CBS domain containing-hemolysin-like protein